MTLLDQFLNVPYLVFWLPFVVFGAVAGSAYWLVRPTSVAPTPPAEATEAPVEAAAAEKTGDQRNAFRRQGNPVEVYVADPNNKEQPGIGSVMDRSLGGVRLALYEEVAIGTVLAIRPVNCDALVPWVEVEIRSCRPSTELPSRFEIGCQYVKSPPYSIQLLFG